MRSSLPGRASRRISGRISLDIGGVALVTGGALGIVWALVRGNSAGWRSLEVVTALSAGALLALAGFIWWERRAREPMLPVHLFRSSAFSAGNGAIFFLWAPRWVRCSSWPSSSDRADFSPLAAGLGLMPWGATTFVAPQIIGALINRAGERLFIAAGMGLNAAALAWIALIAGPGMTYPQMIAPLVLSGIGVAAAIPSTQSAVLRAVVPRYLGKASGAYSTMRQLGGAFGVAVAVAAFGSWKPRSRTGFLRRLCGDRRRRAPVLRRRRRGALASRAGEPSGEAAPFRTSARHGPGAKHGGRAKAGLRFEDRHPALEGDRLARRIARQGRFAFPGHAGEGIRGLLRGCARSCIATAPA